MSDIGEADNPPLIVAVPAPRSGASMTVRLPAGLRVAIVEDEALIAMVLEDHLATLRVEVVCVADTLGDALAIPLDGLSAAIVDIHLGGDDSREAVVRLRTAGVPVIVATGSGSDQLDGVFAECAMLAKPYTLATVERALAVATAAPAMTAAC